MSSAPQTTPTRPLRLALFLLMGSYIHGQLRPAVTVGMWQQWPNKI
jgi:hypothetical protein